MTLGAMTAGVPVAPVSVAYSLQSQDHERIRAIASLVTPGAVFAEDADRFGAALDAVGSVPAIVAAGERRGAESLDEVLATVPGPAVAAAFAAPGLGGEDPVHLGLGRRRACSTPTGCCRRTSR